MEDPYTVQICLKVDNKPNRKFATSHCATYLNFQQRQNPNQSVTDLKWSQLDFLYFFFASINHKIGLQI